MSGIAGKEGGKRHLCSGWWLMTVDDNCPCSTPRPTRHMTSRDTKRELNKSTTCYLTNCVTCHSCHITIIDSNMLFPFLISDYVPRSRDFLNGK
jgi:hypothetical protein